jgi:hypothetical protein
MISLEKGGNEMTRVRKNTVLFVLLLVPMLLTAGCGSSGSSAKSVDTPFEKQDISGVWLGYMANSVTNKEGTFIVGIFTTDDNDNFTGRFIGQDKKYNQYKQYVSPAGFFLTQTADSAVFKGDLDECIWDTNGPAYRTMPLQSISLFCSASTKNVFGTLPFGAYSSKSGNGIIALIYNTTYDVSPNVNNINGDWEIQDSFKQNNTLKLTITPNTSDTTGATIMGGDDLGNTFDGTIKIYYSPLDNKPHNLYDVNLTLKTTDNTNTIDLTGLAAYVLESKTEGITVPKKTLVIGATNQDRSYSFSGLGELIK